MDSRFLDCCNRDIETREMIFSLTLLTLEKTLRLGEFTFADTVCESFREDCHRMMRWRLFLNFVGVTGIGVRICIIISVVRIVWNNYCWGLIGVSILLTIVMMMRIIVIFVMIDMVIVTFWCWWLIVKIRCWFLLRSFLNLTRLILQVYIVSLPFILNLNAPLPLPMYPHSHSHSHNIVPPSSPHSHLIHLMMMMRSHLLRIPRKCLAWRRVWGHYCHWWIVGKHAVVSRRILVQKHCTEHVEQA